jgi:hypothetical protein
MSLQSGTVTVECAGGTREGRALDLSGLGVDPRTVVAAVRTDDSETEVPSDGSETEVPSDGTGFDPPADGDQQVRVDCPTPRVAHEYVGFVTASASLRTRTALAAAARSRGLTTPHDESIRTVRDELATLAVPETPDLSAARERLAGAAAAVERLRERVATLRGRLQARRDGGRDASDVEQELGDATRELSELETERAAAREALDHARRRARESRDARERRRRLEDRLANLEREARAHLVESVRAEFAAAVEAVPTPAESGDAGTRPGADPFEADDVTATLAVGRVAALRAPVVLACERFETPATAAAWLDAPVIRV